MDVDAIVAAADAMEQWLRREDPDVCRLMFRSSIEELAEAAAPILVAAGRRQAADALRRAADSTRETYVRDAFKLAARIAEAAPAEPVEENTDAT